MTEPMAPLMSVAIPSYNHAAYIEACLESVVAQTYPELEIVLVDDGSKDNTFAIAKEFLEKHRERFRRVVAYTRPNRGVSATSNECISQCAGEWVHLLGSDDLLHPEKITRQREAISAWKEPRLALVYADVDYIDPQGRRIKEATKNRPAPGLDFQAYNWLLRNNYIPNPTLAIRKVAFLDVGGFDESLRLEDWDCWLRLSAKYPIARVPKILASYRQHPANTSKNQQMMLEAMFLAFAKFLEQHGKIVSHQTLASSYRKNLHRCWRWCARHDKSVLPQILFDAAMSYVRVPKAADYRRYAKCIRGGASKL